MNSSGRLTTACSGRRSAPLLMPIVDLTSAFDATSQLPNTQSANLKFVFSIYRLMLSQSFETSFFRSQMSYRIKRSVQLLKLENSTGSLKTREQKSSILVDPRRFQLA